MKYTLLLWFIAPGLNYDTPATTESLGDYVTESLCFAAAERVLAERATVMKMLNLDLEIIEVKGAWVAQCRVTE